MIKLREHYLERIDVALTASGTETLLQPTVFDEVGVCKGILWLVPGGGISTKPIAALHFEFLMNGVALSLQFRGEENREPISFSARYADGIDGFFSLLVSALRSRLLTVK